MEAEEQIPNQGWNYWAYTLEGVCYIASSAFWEPGTVLPSYLSGLVSSPILLGLGPALRNAGWLLPQLAVAGYVEGLRRRKPVIVAAATTARIAFLAMLLTVCLPGLAPGLRAGLFLGCYVLFCLAEGVTAVPWTELLSRAVPARLRGRLLGHMESLAGVLALLAGLVVRGVLGSPRFSYPVNYALLFGMGSVLLLGSAGMMSLVREPDAAPGRRRTLGELWREIPGRLRSNGLFRRLVLVRLLAAAPELALPYYVIYGARVLGLPPAFVGSSVTAQMIGSVCGGMLWAKLSYRRGNAAVVRSSCVAGAAIPLFALAAGFGWRVAALRWLVPHVFLLTYVAIGLYITALWIGFPTYLLENVPETERATYVGILGTLSGPLAFLAAPGGLLVAAAGYLPTFALSALLTGIAALAAWTLPPAGTVPPPLPPAGAAAGAGFSLRPGS